jgi:galactokinase/mevalonate kinase-like predicted kinase
MLDFLPELEKNRPDIFVINEDGSSKEKREMCKTRNIEYVVLSRIPHDNLPKRSTTDLRKKCTIPFRIDLAGGWLDQPFVSEYHKGSVLTISIEPLIEFNLRSGMASSSRNRAIELWNSEIPSGNPERLAKILFSFENTPGTYPIAGSQDSLGIVMPGLNKLNYDGKYWPESIESVHNNVILDWLEKHLSLITLGPRVSTFDVLENIDINLENAKKLADAAENCWKAILEKDIIKFGKYFSDSFYAQIKMFPNMVTKEIFDLIEQYKDKAYGWKLSGAGGGGYLILVTDKELDGAIKIKIRRKSFLM